MRKFLILCLLSFVFAFAACQGGSSENPAPPAAGTEASPAAGGGEMASPAAEASPAEAPPPAGDASPMASPAAP